MLQNKPFGNMIVIAGKESVFPVGSMNIDTCKILDRRIVVDGVTYSNLGTGSTAKITVDNGNNVRTWHVEWDIETYEMSFLPKDSRISNIKQNREVVQSDRYQLCVLQSISTNEPLIREHVVYSEDIYRYAIESGTEINLDDIEIPCEGFGIVSTVKLICDDNSNAVGGGKVRLFDNGNKITCKLYKSYFEKSVGSVKTISTHIFYFPHAYAGDIKDQNIAIYTTNGETENVGKKIILNSLLEYEYDIRKEDAKEYAYIRTMPIQTFTVKIVIDFFGTEYSFAPITYNKFDAGEKFYSSTEIQIVSAKLENDIATVTWKALGGGTSCNLEKKFTILVSQNQDEIEVTQNQDTITWEASPGTYTVSITCSYTSGNKIMEAGSLLQDVFLEASVPPEIENFQCDSCMEHTDGGNVYAVSYQPPILLSFDVKSSGIPPQSAKNKDYVVIKVEDNVFSTNEKLSHYSVSIDYQYEVDELDQQSATAITPMTLTFNGFEIQNPIKNFVICAVLPIASVPTIKTERVVYITEETELVKIVFSGVDNLHSPCFGGRSHYEFVYWTPTNQNKKAMELDSVAPLDNSAQSNESGEENDLVASVDFSKFSAGIYYYQIVAVDAIGEGHASTQAMIQKCPANPQVVPPVLASPENGAVDVTVNGNLFRWNKLPDEIMALKCSKQERVVLTLELDSEDDGYDEQVGPTTSIRSVPLTSDEILLKNLLLKLSTKYYWRLTITHDKNDGSPAARFQSAVSTFTTVAKHCAYTNCNNGVCDESTVTCKCNSGFRGEFCDASGLSSLAIGCIVGGVVVVLAAVLVLAFILLRRAAKMGLRIPDLSKHAFLPLKCDGESTDERSEEIPDIEAQIRADPEQGFAFAISVLDKTPSSVIDSMCAALVYAYEVNGKSLDLLCRLIEYEVERATRGETLFRSNSCSTKCFKAYARMIGLPYLFRVLYPLLDKLTKEEQRELAGVVYKGDKEVFGRVDKNTVLAAANYELDQNVIDEEVDADFISANVIAVQIACQMLLRSIDRTMAHCPDDFRRICCVIKEAVEKRFPGRELKLALSAFVFLRYFVAGLAVPESFGITQEPPSESMRRKLVLVSKVLSNISISTPFGDKEPYMVPLNEFIIERENALDSYYGYLATLPRTQEERVPCTVPEKTYSTSLGLIATIATKHEANPEPPKKEKKKSKKKKEMREEH